MWNPVAVRAAGGFGAPLLSAVGAAGAVLLSASELMRVTLRVALQAVLAAASGSVVRLREAGIRGVRDAVEALPSLLLLAPVCSTLRAALQGSAKRVKAEAVALLGPHLSSTSPLAARLLSAFAHPLLSALSDPSVSVRRAALSIFQEALLRSSLPSHARLRSAVLQRMLQRLVHPFEEPSIRAKIASALESLWFRAPDGERKRAKKSGAGGGTGRRSGEEGGARVGRSEEAAREICELVLAALPKPAAFVRASPAALTARASGTAEACAGIEAVGENGVGGVGLELAWLQDMLRRIVASAGIPGGILLPEQDAAALRQPRRKSNLTPSQPIPPSPEKLAAATALLNATVDLLKAQNAGEEEGEGGEGDGEGEGGGGGGGGGGGEGGDGEEDGVVGFDGDEVRRRRGGERSSEASASDPEDPEQRRKTFVRGMLRLMRMRACLTLLEVWAGVAPSLLLPHLPQLRLMIAGPGVPMSDKGMAAARAASNSPAGRELASLISQRACAIVALLLPSIAIPDPHFLTSLFDDTEDMIKVSVQPARTSAFARVLAAAVHASTRSPGLFPFTVERPMQEEEEEGEEGEGGEEVGKERTGRRPEPPRAKTLLPRALNLLQVLYDHCLLARQSERVFAIHKAGELGERALAGDSESITQLRRQWLTRFAHEGSLLNATRVSLYSMGLLCQLIDFDSFAAKHDEAAATAAAQSSAAAAKDGIDDVEAPLAIDDDVSASAAAAAAASSAPAIVGLGHDDEFAFGEEDEPAQSEESGRGRIEGGGEEESGGSSGVEGRLIPPNVVDKVAKLYEHWLAVRDEPMLLQPALRGFGYLCCRAPRLLLPESTTSTYQYVLRSPHPSIRRVALESLRSLLLSQEAREFAELQNSRRLELEAEEKDEEEEEEGVEDGDEDEDGRGSGSGARASARAHAAVMGELDGDGSIATGALQRLLRDVRRCLFDSDAAVRSVARDVIAEAIAEGSVGPEEVARPLIALLCLLPASEAAGTRSHALADVLAEREAAAALLSALHDKHPDVVEHSDRDGIIDGFVYQRDRLGRVDPISASARAASSSSNAATALSSTSSPPSPSSPSSPSSSSSSFESSASNLALAAGRAAGAVRASAALLGPIYLLCAGRSAAGRSGFLRRLVGFFRSPQSLLETAKSRTASTPSSSSASSASSAASISTPASSQLHSPATPATTPSLSSLFPTQTATPLGLSFLRFIAGTMATLPYNTEEGPLFVVHHVAQRVAVRAHDVQRGLSVALLQLATAAGGSAAAAEAQELVAQLNVGLEESGRGVGGGTEEAMREVRRLCAEAAAFILLLTVARHLARVYSLSEERLRQFDPSSGGGAERAISRDPHVIASIELPSFPEWLEFPTDTLPSSTSILSGASRVLQTLATGLTETEQGIVAAVAHASVSAAGARKARRSRSRTSASRSAAASSTRATPKKKRKSPKSKVGKKRRRKQDDDDEEEFGEEEEEEDSFSLHSDDDDDDDDGGDWGKDATAAAIAATAAVSKRARSTRKAAASAGAKLAKALDSEDD